MNIDPAIQTGLLDPFINATASVLRDMAACDAAPRAVEARQRWEPRGTITVLLGLLADKPGAYVLSVPATTAAKLAERLLTEAGIAVDDQLVRDSIGEIANVVGGQAKALTHGTEYTFNLAIPTVLGDRRPTQYDGYACYAIEWSSDLGDFTTFVCRKA